MVLPTEQQEVRIYTTGDGRSPYSEWIDSLRDVRGRAVVRARIARVRNGNFGNCDPVGHGVLELKIDFGPGYRVYFGRQGTELAILLCGGDKGSQERDIKRAQEYWLNYRRRGDDGEE